MADIKLIAIDIDGTLLNSQHELTQGTIDTIKRATQKGIKVVLCTGRPLTGVSPYLDQLGLNGQADQYAITYNGGMAQQLDGNVLVSHSLTHQDYLDLEALARQLDVHFQIETPDYIYTTNKNISAYTIGESYLVRMLIRYRDRDEMPKDLTISKAMFVDDPAIIDRVNPKIPESIRDQYYIVQSEPYFIEIMNKAASKGNTLSGLAEKLGLTAENVMAIGDQGNDLTMIEYAGTGVAMGNGIDPVKQAASFITKTNDEDGVAFAIEKFAL